jgi:hypothetical protein
VTTIVENFQTEAFLGLEQPAHIGAAVTGRLEQEILL